MFSVLVFIFHPLLVTKYQAAALDKSAYLRLDKVHVFLHKRLLNHQSGSMTRLYSTNTISTIRPSSQMLFTNQRLNEANAEWCDYQESGMPIDHQNFRLRGIPCEYESRADVHELVKTVLSIAPGASFRVHSLAINPVEQSSKVATLSFHALPEELSDDSRNEWVFNLPADNNPDSFGPIKCLVFDTHFSGFTPLQHTRDDDCHVDVIAISGLGGHAALQIDVKGIQRSNQRRAIIFIGHSLGGLVIKEAMVKLTEEMDEEDAPILDCVSGFLFFGVPHQGMAIHSIVPLVQDNPNRSLLESLSTNSALLPRLEKEFNTAFSVRCPRIIAFYETESSPTAEERGGKWTLSGPSKVLVDVSSATCGTKNQHPINRTHSGMVKFKHQYDELYMRVKTALQPLLSSQGKFAAGITEVGYSHCLRSLAFREQGSRYDDIHSATDTCEWLFEDSQYQTWMNRRRGLFWIKGNPGSGKSVLMKFAVTTMHRRKSGELVVSFFFHGRGTSLQKTPLGAFRALLNSMLTSFPEYLSQLTTTFQDRESRFGSYGMNRWDWTAKELQEAMLEILTKGTKNRPVAIFVDALDECGEDYAKYLLEQFKKLMDDVNREEGQVKICFSSRHYPILGLRTIPTIFVEEHNDKDIRSIIQERLKEIKPKEKRQQIENEILSKAQGGFQWAVLVTAMVIKSNTIGTKADKLYKSLATIPETLNELYTSILNDISEPENNLMVKLFQWILFAERPLSAQELREALATDKNMACTTVSELRMHDSWADSLGEFETHVKHISRGLVEFQTRDLWEQYEPEGEFWDREAQFIHQSVADYMLQKFLGQHNHCRSAIQSQIGAGHFEISRSCLRYIKLEEVLEGGQLPRGTLSARFPLAPYAVRFLFHHVQMVEREGIPQPDLLSLIQWEKQFELGKVERLWRVLDSESVHTPMGWPFIKATPLHVLVAFGSKSALDEYLQKDDVEVDGRDVHGNTPLLLAVRERHQDLALALLNQSIEWKSRSEVRSIAQGQEIGQQTNRFVDINTENYDGDTPLTIALAENAEEVIFKLIEDGADVKYFQSEAALVFHALHHRNKLLLLTLIEKKAKLDGAVYFALKEMPLEGRDYVLEELISELLKAGANTSKLLESEKNNKDPYWDDDDDDDDEDDWETNEYDDGILLASRRGQTAMVKLLLSHGASAIFQDEHGTCPLLAAVENGHAELAKVLLYHDPSAVAMKNSSGLAALDTVLLDGEFGLAMDFLREGMFSSSPIISRNTFFYAIETGQSAIVKAILQKDKSPLEFVNTAGTTALQFALNAGNEELVLILITEGHTWDTGGNGADLDSRNTTSLSPLLQAASNGYEAVVKLLLEKGAVIELKDSVGRTPLLWAAINGHEAVVKLLLEKGAAIKLKDSVDRTPLLWAAINDHKAIVKLLLENGADIESRDIRYGRTPLLCAAMNGHEAIVKLLLEKGAVIELKDGVGRTPLLWAAMNGYEAILMLLLENGASIQCKDDYGHTPLSWAAIKGQDAVVKLLLENGLDIESRDILYGQTPLSWAAINGREAIVKLLFEQGAAVEFSDVSCSHTPLIWTAMNGHEAIIELLLEKGANIESRDGEGRTPLFWAAFHGHEATVKLLLRKGANIGCEDSSGRSPLWWAAEKGYTAIVQLLEQGI
ncbi:Serine/threonine-protein phosphatase 6 regulatory ankyrin repeat subunit B [Cladobotryum mycophilum]|uniref:Serine/threonine-protein phosphatase 6 regulatory ankyrin repeat subunit B n=1 Tax=Cladobotryum mycophilum TaxID=491253 RepID=A0ABR0ST84_9HYPO